MLLTAQWFVIWGEDSGRIKYVMRIHEVKVHFLLLLTKIIWDLEKE